MEQNNMKKIGVIIGALIVVLLASYSVYWFYTANKLKTFVANTANQIESHLSKDGVTTKFTYSELKTTGFPWAYKITMHNPKLETNSSAFDGSIAFDSVEFSQDGSGKNFTLAFSEDATIMENDKKLPMEIPAQTTPEAEAPKPDAKPINLKYKASTKSTIEFNFAEPVNKLAKDEAGKVQLSEILKLLNKVNYRHDSYEMTNADNNEKVVTGEPGYVNIDMSNDGDKKKMNIEYSMSYKYLPAAESMNFFGIKLSLLGDQSSKASIKFTYTPSADNKPLPLFDLEISNLEFANNFIFLSIVGTAATDQQHILPMAELKIHAQNYKPLLDTLVQHNFINQKEADLANKIVNKLAGIEQEPGYDVNLAFSSDGNGSFKVGAMTMQEVTTYIDEENKKLKEEMANQPQETPGEVIPGAVPAQPGATPESGAAPAPTAPTAPAPTATAPTSPAPAPIAPAMPAKGAPAATNPVAPAPVTPAAPSAPAAAMPAPAPAPTPAPSGAMPGVNNTIPAAPAPSGLPALQAPTPPAPPVPATK